MKSKKQKPCKFKKGQVVAIEGGSYTDYGVIDNIELVTDVYIDDQGREQGQVIYFDVHLEGIGWWSTKGLRKLSKKETG